MRRLIVLCFLPIALVSAGCNVSTVQSALKRGGGHPGGVMVSANNGKMNAAIDEARRTVPQFIAAIKAHKPDQRFVVKVKVSDGVTTEHMWLQGLTYDGTAFHGALLDDPYEVKGYKMGQEMTVKPTEISDWMIITPAGREGGFTEKVIKGK